ncbi:MAG: CHAD domain-containing protein [Caldilineaceae bacterium]|nr:CHAD domain-containing protein [Caldilineaceae bacterium]
MSEHRCSAPSSQRFLLAPAALDSWRILSALADHYPLTTEPSPAVDEQLIYIDTADYRLLRTGFAACVTQRAEQTCLTVENLALDLAGKVDKPITRRHQGSAPIDAAAVATTFKAWPKALRKAVTPVLGGHAKLHPILALQQHSEARTIGLPTADVAPSPFTKVHLDQITVRPTTELVDAPVTRFAQLRLQASTPADDTKARAERPGDETEQGITNWLMQQAEVEATGYSAYGLLTAALTAFLAQGVDNPTSASIQPQTLVANACRLIWREQLLNMLLNEAGVRYSQEREYVHNMRVAIRRARAAAKLYGDFLPRKAIRPYLAALRKTGRLLGHVRNLDVALAKARRRAQTGQAEPAPKKLLKVWRQQRQAAHELLVRWLDSEEYRDFICGFHHFCTATTPEQEAADAVTPQHVRHVVPAQIIAGYAAVRCYEVLFVEATAIEDAALHDLRIACKHLRYNLEFMHHLLGPACEPLITRLKALQELLGDLNDAVVAQGLVDEAHQERSASVYQQQQADLVAELRQQVPAAFAALVDPASRTALHEAVARL